MDTIVNSVYDNNLKIKDALQLYFSKYHFENGGYHLKYFKIKVGSLFIILPNWNDRVATAKFHDIHHVLTEYPATLKGEAEIGAWEIASGCDRYYVAWFFNLGAFFYGLFCFPKAIFNAFMNARKCRTNLYHNNMVYDETLLNKTVGEMRENIGINSTMKNTASDYISFVFWSCLLVSLYILLPIWLLC